MVKRTLPDLYCQYSSSQAASKLSQSALGHFVTLIEIGLQLVAILDIVIIYNFISYNACFRSP